MSDEDIIPITTKRAFVRATALPANQDLVSGVCLICKEKISDLCVSCQTNKDRDDCLISRGGCGHLFHEHCLKGWLDKSTLCPVCQQQWVTDGAPFPVN